LKRLSWLSLPYRSSCHKKARNEKQDFLTPPSQFLIPNSLCSPRFSFTWIRLDSFQETSVDAKTGNTKKACFPCFFGGDPALLWELYAALAGVIPPPDTLVIINTLEGFLYMARIKNPRSLS
jgi:hypothetical protein